MHGLTTTPPIYPIICEVQHTHFASINNTKPIIDIDI